MTWWKLFFYPTGRIGRRTFVLAELGLYAALFLTPTILELLASLMARGDKPNLGYVATAAPPLILFQVLAPYANICLHLKRLRDAGRGPGSLIAMAAFSIAAIPAALAIGTWTLRDQSSVENLNFPITWIVAIVLACVVVALSWLAYSIWVALGEPRGPRGQAAERTGAQFE